MTLGLVAFKRIAMTVDEAGIPVPDEHYLFPDEADAPFNEYSSRQVMEIVLSAAKSMGNQTSRASI